MDWAFLFFLPCVPSFNSLIDVDFIGLGFRFDDSFSSFSCKWVRPFFVRSFLFFPGFACFIFSLWRISWFVSGYYGITAFINNSVPFLRMHWDYHSFITYSMHNLPYQLLTYFGQFYPPFFNRSLHWIVFSLLLLHLWWWYYCSTQERRKVCSLVALHRFSWSYVTFSLHIFREAIQPGTPLSGSSTSRNRSKIITVISVVLLRYRVDAN